MEKVRHIEQGLAIGRPRLTLLALLVAVAIIAALANPSSAGATLPFAPSLEVSVGNANPGAITSITNTHTVPGGQHVLDSVNVIVPNSFGLADSNIPISDVVGEVRMDLDVGCTNVVQPFAAAPLVNFPADPSLKAEWRATLGGMWQMLFTVENLPANAGSEIAVTLVNASMPSLYCSPQNFSYTIFGTSIPGGVTLATNPSGVNSDTWSVGYLSFSFTGIQNEHTHVSTDSVLIDLDTDSDGLADSVDTDDDGDSLGLGNPLWFRDVVELFVGTDPLIPCANDTTPDNEVDDKWPADFNDDQAVNIQDRALVVSQLLSGPYDVRFDLNTDSALNILDRAVEVLYVLEFQKTGACPTL